MDKKDMVNVIHIHLKWVKEPSDPSQQWKQSNEGFNRGYKFTYDALNRLTEAVYGENDFSDNLNDYNEKVVEYSLNGMMKRFQRRGKKSDGEYGKVDNLHIHLDGNRPVEISDDAALQTVYGAMEFRDGSTSGTEYYYDGNGSLVADANKGIAMIEYDNLNYPRRIQFTNGNTIEYVYSPDGQKLRAKWQTAAGNVVVPLNTTQSITASSTTQTDYVGDLIYTGTDATADNPELSKILYPDGYFMRTSGTSGVFRYFVKDHLGNNRVVNNGTAVYQRTHYYPFGGLFGESTNGGTQVYKYNGKELDRINGLDWYDYGARHMSPDVGRFTTIDPMAEKYYHLSPYAYCGNNPVNAIDPDGKYVTYTNNSNKITYVYYKGNFYQNIFRRVNGQLVPKNGKVHVPANSYMFRALQALRKMENSQNEKIKEVFNVVSDIESGKEHNIHAGIKGEGSFTYHEGRGNTTTSLNFEEDNKISNTQGSVSFTDYEVLGHELKHAYDFQEGINSSKKDENGVQYDEYKAVQFENLIRKEENRPLRTTYGEHPLPNEYLNQ